jgi:hypothetical protein
MQNPIRELTHRSPVFPLTRRIHGGHILNIQLLYSTGVSILIREMALATELEMAAETLLWHTAIARNVQDSLSKPLPPEREAKWYQL